MAILRSKIKQLAAQNVATKVTLKGSRKNNMIVKYPACGTDILEKERSTEKNETHF